MKESQLNFFLHYEIIRIKRETLTVGGMNTSQSIYNYFLAQTLYEVLN